MIKSLRQDGEKRGQQIIVNPYDKRASIIWKEGVRIYKNSFSLTIALQKTRDSGLTLRLRNMCFFAMTSSITFANSLSLSKSHLRICDTGIKIMNHHCKNQRSLNCKQNHDLSRNHCFC